MIANHVGRISIAEAAVQALIAEAELTPKPALVDLRGNGAHHDLSLDLLVRSARALRETFEEVAAACRSARPDVALRERLGVIGREGERHMLIETGGVNTHRGALWSLGLLVAACSLTNSREPERIAAAAGAIAALPDRAGVPIASNGARARAVFGVRGAVGEARDGFPHVVRVALPMLREARARGVDDGTARVNALLAIMATLEDTCLLHRGGIAALRIAQERSQAVLAAGGFATPRGARTFDRLEASLLAHNASPGGAADLLAAAILLDCVERRACA
ncbi:MAG: triphosphoribosyl-dephospho-CoA synthase [Vulcanimicrobiaceae bacterium]